MFTVISKRKPREILFRGQTRKYSEKVRMDGTPIEGNWVEGGIYPNDGDYSTIYTLNPVEKFSVYSDTIGEYTGFETRISKERIFEDDILRCRLCAGETYSDCYAVVVKGKNGCWNLHELYKDGTMNSLPFITLKEASYEMLNIVGNTHDGFTHLICPQCGSRVQIHNNKAKCDCCGWSVKDNGIDDFICKELHNH